MGADDGLPSFPCGTSAGGFSVVTKRMTSLHHRESTAAGQVLWPAPGNSHSFFLPESSSNNRRPRSGGMTSSFSATTTATGPLYSLRFRTLSYLSRVIHLAGRYQKTDCAISGSVSQGVINNTPATGACFEPATADAMPHPNDSPSRRSEERRVGKECRSRWS